MQESLKNIKTAVALGATLGVLEGVFSNSFEKGAQQALGGTVIFATGSEIGHDMQRVLNSALEANKGRFLLSSVKLIVETAVAGAYFGFAESHGGDDSISYILIGAAVGATSATVATAIEGRKAFIKGRSQPVNLGS